MNQRVMLEPAFILHRRPYRNTSLILDLFTKYHGRLSVVARSARGLKSRYRGVLQLFTPLLVSFSGKTELKSLGQVELTDTTYALEGQALLCAFYLNELLQRLLLQEDPYPDLFEDYQLNLMILEKKQKIQANLRYFEKRLLDQLGYGLSLDYEIKTRTAFCPQSYYRWLPEQGFVACAPAIHDPRVFIGKSLIALQQEKLDDPQSLADAKRLLRPAIARHLGNKPLKSREMFV